MGPDGHTASLFPGHPLLGETNRLISWISDSPKPPPERITFSFPLINNGKNLFFVATGEAKKEILAQVLEGDKSKNIPSQLVKPVHGQLIWFIDKAAALNLKNKL